ncbi:MAG: hypothetical protein WBH03_18940, partial [Cyclobacteriaceae bacterium]
LLLGQEVVLPEAIHRAIVTGTKMTGDTELYDLELDSAKQGLKPSLTFLCSSSSTSACGRPESGIMPFTILLPRFYIVLLLKL